MRNKWFCFGWIWIGLAVGLIPLVVKAADADSTAFELIKEGNQYLSVDAKDRILAIRSEKSIGSLTPNIWYIAYYDPDATGRATEVKFGAGKKLAVKRPFRVSFKKPRELDREKLKLDSDKAIKIALAEPLLTNLKITSTRLWLEEGDGPDQPVWKVRLWAEKLRDPTRSADIGNVFISAETGKVVRNDLHIQRVD